MTPSTQNALHSWLSDLYSLLFPRLCPCCGQRMEPSEEVLCAVCSMFLPRLPIHSTDDNEILRILWNNIPAEHALALLAYRHHSDFHKILMRIKYRGDTKLAREMGRWAAIEATQFHLEQIVDALVPVPLTPQKQRQRGYNQARLLAQGMAEHMRKPVLSLLRRNDTQTTQTHLGKQERQQNVQGNFQAKIPPKWRGKHFLLVDDVMTTGSTLKACAKAILEQDSSARISVLTLAFAG